MYMYLFQPYIFPNGPGALYLVANRLFRCQTIYIICNSRPSTEVIVTQYEYEVSMSRYTTPCPIKGDENRKFSQGYCETPFLRPFGEE